MAHYNDNMAVIVRENLGNSFTAIQYDYLRDRIGADNMVTFSCFRNHVPMEIEIREYEEYDEWEDETYVQSIYIYHLAN